MTIEPPLYKFLSLAPGQSPSWERRLDELLAGRCYLSSAADFNDPFDCLPFIASPPSQAELATWGKKVAISMTQALGYDLPPEFVQQRIAETIGGHSPESIVTVLQQAARQNAAGMGVFCLAECVDSVLMWSHYASNHRGVALRFEFGKDPQSSLRPLWKIAYQEHRPVVRDFYSGQANPPLADVLAIKADFWSYEQEWRAMKPDHARQTVLFDPCIITGLVLGAQCTEADADWLRRHVGGRAIELFHMTPHPTEFRLVLERLPIMV